MSFPKFPGEDEDPEQATGQQPSRPDPGTDSGADQQAPARESAAPADGSAAAGAGQPPPPPPTSASPAMGPPVPPPPHPPGPYAPTGQIPPPPGPSSGVASGRGYPPPPAAGLGPPPGYPRTAGPLPADGPTDGTAVAALVCGIVGLLMLCAWGLGTLPSIVALILGIVARNRLSQPGNQQRGRGMAVAGIVLGAIGAVLGLLFIVLLIIASADSSTYYG